MITERYLDLMNAEIDGANTSDDSRRLEEYLRNHNEARRYYDELRAAVEALEKAQPFAPPADLRRSILATMPEPDAIAAARRFAGRWRRRRPGLVYAFAAGLVVGMLFLGAVYPRLASERAPAQRDLYGAAGPGAVFVRDVVIDEDGVNGRVQFAFAADRVTIHVDLEAAGTVRLDLDHDPGLTAMDVRFRGPAAPALVVGPGHLNLEHQGRIACDVVLDGAAAARRPLTFSMQLDGAPLLDRVIDPH